jgi:hypothetical protein
VNDETPDPLVARLDSLTAEVSRLIQLQSEQMHSRQRREWEPFFFGFGGVTAAATSTGLAAMQAFAGWELRIYRTVVTVAGANVVAYVNTDGTATSGPAGDQTAADFQVGMYGNSPSRAISDNRSALYVPPGHFYVVALSSTVAAANPISVTVTGERRQV